MFNIKKIILHNEAKTFEIPISNYNFIIGKNSTGKTVFYNIINFMLGSSNDVFELQGLDNITSIEIKIENNDKFLYAKRTRKDFYIKENSIYNKKTSKEYKNCITNFISQNDKFKEYFKIYKDIYEEDLTCRAFSFINLLDEKGLGNITSVFTDAKENKNIFRTKKIMQLLFNLNNLKKQITIEKEIKTLEKQIVTNTTEYYKFSFYENSIKNCFEKLNLKYNENNYEINYKNYLNYKNNQQFEQCNLDVEIIETEHKKNKCEQKIRVLKSLKKEISSIDQKQKNINALKNLLLNITEKNDNYHQLTTEIEKNLNNVEQQEKIYNLFDYEYSIQELNNKIIAYNKDLQIAKNLTNNLSIQDKFKYQGVIETSFENFDKKIDKNNIDLENKKLDDYKNELKSIKKNYISEDVANSINKYIHDKYLDSDMTFSFIKQDKKTQGFKIKFNPLLLNICGEKEEIKNNKILKKVYLPGSMARQTMWQILTYLAIHDYLNIHFKDLSYLPVLLLDSINQPFDESFNENSQIEENLKLNMEKFYKLIKDECQRMGLQLFIFSKSDSNIEDYDKINLNEFENKGFNPWHNE